MANKIIKYNLESDGTIPTHIADGGYYPKAIVIIHHKIGI